MPRLLLIEDDDAVREGLEIALRHQGHQVESAATGRQGLDLVRTARPDAVVLDLMLPDLNGFEVCRRLREMGNLPIIMLTARGDDFDVVAGLEAGADDYVIKPVQPRVLDARIQAVLRRIGRIPAVVLSHGEIAIDRAALMVTKSGLPVSLTATELRLLLVLAESPHQVFARDQLLRLVWEQDYLGDSRLVDACIQRLRAKIEDNPSAPTYLQTVRGFGYRFGPV